LPALYKNHARFRVFIIYRFDMALGGRISETERTIAIIGGLWVLLIVLLELRKVRVRRQLQEEKALQERVSFHFV